MTQIEKIKTEIERRMKCYDRGGIEPNDAKWVELISIKHFIESLEKEQDSRYDRVMAYVESRYKTLADGKGNTPEGNGYLVGMGDILRFAEKLEELPTDDSPKIKGWVARDKDDSLHVFEVEPRRTENNWWDRDYQCKEIAKECYPELTWESEPIEVELTIHRV